LAIHYTLLSLLIYGNVFGNLAANIDLYGVIVIQGFNNLYKVGWIATFIEHVP
jgi:hypothetical protein